VEEMPRYKREELYESKEGSRMTLKEILDKYHEEIVRQWANRLHTAESDTLMIDVAK
jgi:hypothetical protein